MTVPRSQIVSYDDTPFYHVISRCVQHTFLCGIDPYTKKDYNHRKQWIEDRIRILSSLFSIEICSYAVMSSHYHIVLKALPDEGTAWSDREVIKRWLSVYRGSNIERKFINNEPIKPYEKDAVDSKIPIWRERLKSISWFMKSLNEPLAREANSEMGTEGNFWISRFKSYALLDEEAVLTAMAYVDLNPVHAKMAKTPESSKNAWTHSSIYPAVLKPTVNMVDSQTTYSLQINQSNYDH